MKRMDLNCAHSAQGILNQSVKPAACGAACGTGDKPAPAKPAACGSACGTGDKPAPAKPAACGSACGTGDK